MIEITQYWLTSDVKGRKAHFAIEAAFWGGSIEPDWYWADLMPRLMLGREDLDESFDCVTLKHYHPVL